MSTARILRAAALTAGLLLAWAPAEAHGYASDHLLTTDDIGPNKIPATGTSQILVVPVHVGPDGFSAAQLSELQTTFDAQGAEGSFRHYWQTVSGGRYDPIPTVVAPVEYPDSCPLPGKTVTTCALGYDDLQLFFSGGVAVALQDMLERVRDEQNVDLGQFDVNGAAGTPDGYFDGVVFVSNIAEGVAPPLAEIYNETTVVRLPGGSGEPLTLGIAAMAPPVHHEFAHMFGFIDLYWGPPVNGLMSEDGVTLSAFSRQQVGWGDVQRITEPIELDLAPVLDSQQLLRIGDGPRYLLIENRNGPQHAAFEVSAPGIYVYSVDEEQLPTMPRGFIDASSTTGLYLPNEAPPYANVAMPVNCSLLYPEGPTGCAIEQLGEERALSHASGLSMGFTLRVVDGPRADGSYRIQLYDARGPEVLAGGGDEPSTADDGGCHVVAAHGGAGSYPAWWALAVGLLFRWRRRQTARPRSALRRRAAWDRAACP
jgi:MYXO-CTERM domain-containing protein